MGDLLIRNLDDGVVAAFEVRARINGTSLEQEVRETLKARARELPKGMAENSRGDIRGLGRSYGRLTPEQKVAISREILSRTKGIVPSLTAEERREGLE